MSGRVIPTILGKEWGFPGIGPQSTFWPFMAGLRTVMALVGMCCIPTNVLQWAYNEAQGLSQFSRSVVPNSLRPHRLQHARLPCPSPTPRACSNSCPSSCWCHPTISPSVIPFSSHLQSFPASGSFPMSQFCTSGGQSIGVSASASVLPMNIQDRVPLGWTGWISLLSKGLLTVFSSTTVQKHQFFGVQLSLWAIRFSGVAQVPTLRCPRSFNISFSFQNADRTPVDFLSSCACSWTRLPHFHPPYSDSFTTSRIHLIPNPHFPADTWDFLIPTHLPFTSSILCVYRFKTSWLSLTSRTCLVPLLLPIYLHSVSTPAELPLLKCLMRGHTRDAYARALSSRYSSL